MSASTLGWIAAEWMYEHLPSPADPTRKLELTDWQLDFILSWYEFDSSLEFVHRRGGLMLPKGAGKSPFGAALALFEFAGPANPDGFDAARRPVGRPWGTLDAPPAWVQVAGVAEDAAVSNVYAVIFEMLSVSGGKAARDLDIDEGRTRLYLKDRPAAKLEAVTASSGAREGQRVTFGLLDETMLWTPSSGGTKLARTIRRNCGKTKGRSIELTNAPILGAGSVAEETMHDAEAGEPGILFFAHRPSAEPEPQMEDRALRVLLGEVYAGCPWIDLDRIVREIRDVATPWDEACRYYLNTASAGSSALVDPTVWAGLVAEEPADGARIGLGFGASEDGAALVGATEAGVLFSLGLWERPQGDADWRVPRAEVDRAVTSAFSTFSVGRFLASPREWVGEVERWVERHGELVLAFPTSSVRRMDPAISRFRVAAIEGGLHHDDGRDLARHVANAQLRSSTAGYVLSKASPSRAIDAATAAVLAFEAAATMEPAKPEGRVMVAWR